MKRGGEGVGEEGKQAAGMYARRQDGEETGQQDNGEAG